MWRRYEKSHLARVRGEVACGEHCRRRLVADGEVGVESAGGIGVVVECYESFSVATPPAHGAFVAIGVCFYRTAVGGAKRAVEAIKHVEVACSKRVAKHGRGESAAGGIVEHHIAPIVVEHGHVAQVNHVVVVAINVVTVGEKVVDGYGEHGAELQAEHSIDAGCGMIPNPTRGHDGAIHSPRSRAPRAMRRRAWTTPTPIVVAIMVVEAVVEMILVAAWIAVVGSVVARATSIIVLAIIAVATMVTVVGAIAYVRAVVAVVGAIAYVGAVVTIVGAIAYIGSVVAIVGAIAYIGSVVTVVGAIAYVGSVVAIVGSIAYVGSVVAIVGAIAYIGSVTVVVSHIGTVIPIPAVCGCLALLNRSAVLFSTHAIGRRAIVWAIGILRRARNRRCTAALC